MTPTLPTVGRIVLFNLPEGVKNAGQERAALVTGAFGASLNINLNVFLDQEGDSVCPGFHPNLRVWSAAYDESGKPGTWHWPVIGSVTNEKPTRKISATPAAIVTVTDADLVPVTSTTATPDVAPPEPAISTPDQPQTSDSDANNPA